MEASYVLIIAVGVGVLLAWLALDVVWNRHALANRRVTIQKRSTRSIDSWYAQEFEPLGLNYVSTVIVAQLLAKHLQCDISQIYASDRFDGVLRAGIAPFLGIVDEDGPLLAFTEDLYSLFGGKWPPEVSRAETVGQCVKACTPFLNELTERV